MTRLLGFLPPILAVIALALFGIGLAASLYPLPYFDFFIFADFALRPERGLADFFAPFGENRPALMRLLAALDLALTGGSTLFFSLLSLAALLAIALATIPAAFVLRVPSAIRFALAAMIVALLARAFGLELFIWGHGLQFALCTAFTIAAIALAGAREGSLGAMLGATLLAALASLSYGNGVLAWPLTAGAGLLARNRAWPLALIVGIAWGVTLYAVGWPAHLPAHHTSPLAALAQPLALLEYVAHYLGSPWTRLDWARPIGYAMTLAIALAPLALLVAPSNQPRRRGMRQEDILILGLILFALGNAALTALVRLDFGPAQAAIPRYWLFAAPGWIGAALAYARLLENEWWQRPGLVRLGLLGATLLTLAICLEQPYANDRYRRVALRLEETAIAVAAGARDSATLGRLYPNTAFALHTLDRARLKGAYIFRDPATLLVGRQLADAGLSRDDKACIGAIDFLGPGESDGTWLYGYAKADGLRAVIVANETGRIVGFGRSSGKGDGVEEWRAYAPGPAGAALAVYAVTGAAICRLDGTSLVEAGQ